MILRIVNDFFQKSALLIFVRHPSDISKLPSSLKSIKDIPPQKFLEVECFRRRRISGINIAGFALRPTEIHPSLQKRVPEANRSTSILYPLIYQYAGYVDRLLLAD